MNVRKMRSDDVPMLRCIEQSVLTGRGRLDFSPPREVFVLESEGTIVGYVAMHVMVPEAEILDISVRRQKQGNGLGKTLMKNVVAHCRQRGVETIHLETAAGDDHALAFFRSMGFSTIRRRQGYYEDAGDALAMALDIGGEP